eukprot:m.407025 g.407025  ORF g.407025 m.407025 type:complete len:337 (-) comp56503_c0_seq12:263-1273(-)
MASFAVRFKPLQHEEFVLQLHVLHTIAQVKGLISMSKPHFPATLLRLFFKGKPLIADLQTVEEAGIAPDDFLVLMCAPTSKTASSPTPAATQRVASTIASPATTTTNTTEPALLPDKRVKKQKEEQAAFFGPQPQVTLSVGDVWGLSVEMLEATLRQRADRVTELLDAGANVNFLNAEGSSALHVATRMGAAEIVDILLNAKAIVDIEDAQQSTPLLYAIVFSRPEMVEKLLKAGADPSFTLKDGSTPTHRTADQRSVQIILAILRASACADLNSRAGFLNAWTKEPLRYTPLHWAIRRGQLAQVITLIKAGAFIDTRWRTDTSASCHLPSSSALD